MMDSTGREIMGEAMKNSEAMGGIKGETPINTDVDFTT